MKKIFKIFLTIIIVIAGIASFLYLCLRNRDSLGEYYAQSSINIEMDWKYTENIAIAIETSPDPCSYWLSPTTSQKSSAGTVVMHKSIPLKRPFWKPAIQLPQKNADAAISAIDHIAFFIGNKLFYFSHNEIQQFKRVYKNGYALYYLPDIHYEKSLVFSNWSNYYGDFNFSVIALTSFFLYPARFIPVYLLLGLLLFLYRKRFREMYASIMRNKKTYTAILLVIIIAAGFVMRFNGYIRHSAWSDELYSAIRASSPAQPFINTFNDAGNPPFYFILLRIWFMIFGWTEGAGTMLSVLIGTFSVLTAYLLVKPYFGKKTALFTALFIAFSGFSIGYSQEMRSYILQTALVPLVSAALFGFIKKPSVRNLILYILPSIALANSHFYGVIFIIANFVFYIALTAFRHQWQWKNVCLFFTGNVIVAGSFLPYFMYSIILRGTKFNRNISLEIGHILVFVVIIVLTAAFFIYKNKIVQKISDIKIVQKDQISFIAYLILIPALTYMLSFVISFIHPMIGFRFLWPINVTLCFAFAAVCIYIIHSIKKWRCISPLLVYMTVVGLHGTVPDIPSGGIEGYKEARSYIAADAASHSEKKPVMLNNAPGNAQYYGFPILPSYSENKDADVLYIYNDIFDMHEIEMYDAVREAGIDDSDIIKILFDCKYPRGDGGVIFKKYLR